MDVVDPDSIESRSSEPTVGEGDAEAALEALRAAIGQPVDDDPPPPFSFRQSRMPIDAQQTLAKALAALSQLSSTSQTILDNLNLPGVIQGLTGSLKVLVESNRRQAEIVHGLLGQLSGQGEPGNPIFHATKDADDIGLSFS